MKKTVLLIAFLAWSSTFAIGAPICDMLGTLATYEALGATGCQIGDYLFNNFDFSVPVQSLGASPLPSDGITVTGFQPDPGVVELRFQGNFQVGSLAFVGYVIQYDVTRLFGELSGASVTLGSHSTTGPGSIDLTKNITLSNGTVIGSADVFQHPGGASVDFQSTTWSPPLTSIHVIDSLSLNGGEGGTASVSDFANTLGTPEPMSVLLLGSGLAIMGALRRRRL